MKPCDALVFLATIKSKLDESIVNDKTDMNLPVSLYTARLSLLHTRLSILLRNFTPDQDPCAQALSTFATYLQVIEWHPLVRSSKKLRL